MAGLVFLADFFDWNAQEAIEAYIFRSDVQYALNLEPGATVCTRTLERYQEALPRRRPRRRVFDDVTTRLIHALDLDVSRQRLDSTHVFSHMASFGRTKLRLIFYSCASVFDVSPLVMGRGSPRSVIPSATPLPEIPLKSRD